MTEYDTSWYNISDMSNNFDIWLNISDQYWKNIELFVNSILKTQDLTSYDKVIIWDDWGKILEYIKKLPINKLNFYWIEHTSNWFNKLNNSKIEFPIVNVARSDIKLEIESVFVAELAYKNFIELTNIELNPNMKVLVIGWGAIWNALKSLIDDDFDNVIIVDSDSEKSDLEDYNLLEVIENSDIIFWCTWNSVITFDDFSKLSKWKYFASLSFLRLWIPFIWS
jgi:hypothetical protein